MKTDDRLERDLKAAYGRDLPGAEFDDRVMDAIDAEGAGGESEFCVPLAADRRLPWGAILVAASLLFAVLGLLRLRSADGPVAAGPGDEDVKAEVKIAWKDLGHPIGVQADGFKVGGRIVRSDGLVEALAEEVGKLRKAGDDDPAVALAAEAWLPWRHVHEAVLRLADPEVRVSKLQFVVVDPEDRAVTFMVPLELPRDEGLTPGARPRKEAEVVFPVELSRAGGEKETRVLWCGVELGRDEVGLAALTKRLAGEDPGQFPGVVEIKAWGPVPFGRVLDLMALLREAGIPKLHLNGDAPEVFMIDVSLQPKDGRTVMWLDGEGDPAVSQGVAYKPQRLQVFEMEDGLKELARRIKAAQADGRKPHGFLSARVYVDQDAVEKVMKVFEENGVKDVVRLS